MDPDALKLTGVIDVAYAASMSLQEMAISYDSLSEYFKKMVQELEGELIEGVMTEKKGALTPPGITSKMKIPVADGKGGIGQMVVETLDEMCMQCGYTSRFWKVPPPGKPFRCVKCGAEL